MDVHYLNQSELAQRWSLSPRTLERWRWLGQGPAYVKLGGRVAYRLEDIQSYEAERTHRPGRNSTVLARAPWETEANQCRGRQA